MFGMLDALRTSLSQAVNLAGADRLMLQSKVNDHRLAAPWRTTRRSRRCRACARSRHSTGSAASTRTASTQIQVQAIDAGRDSSRCIRNCKLKPEELAAWKKDRQGIVIGQVLAETYGWKSATAFRSARTSGARRQQRTWEFNIVGIYERRRQRLGQAQRDVPLRLLQRVAAVRQGPGRLDGDQGRRPDAVRRDRAAHRRHVRELAVRDQDGHRARVHQAVPRPDGQHRHDPGVGDHGGVLHHVVGHREHDGAIGPRTHQRDRRAEDARVSAADPSSCWCCSSRCS